MDTKAKVVIVTLIYSFTVLVIHEKIDIKTVGEFVSLIYFLLLLMWVYFREKNNDIYKYLSLVYFTLLVIFSYVGDQDLSEITATYLFYSLASFGCYNFIRFIRHEK